jgi:serine phosphatase RsbU (regulator of sigma subunit)
VTARSTEGEAVTTADASERRLRGVLEAAEAASPVDAVEAVTGELGKALGAARVSFLIADLAGRSLARLTVEPGEQRVDRPGRDDGGPVRRSGQEAVQVLAFDDGPMERALREQTLACTRRDTGWQVLAPVTERGEALGLLELILPDEPDEPDEQALETVRRCAHILAFVVIANRRHTDLFEWAQRTAPPTLSAEIQRRLLPAAYTCEAAAFTLAGWLEPAGSVAGDTFDYSLGRDTLHLSITDAMGHGVDSALIATLCVGSLRNSRRQGFRTAHAASRANDEIVQHVGEGEAFATGLLASVHLRSGILTAVNAGHVQPLLVRSGRVDPLHLPADLPLGMLPGTSFHSTDVQLQPGDRLLLVTDGMLERKAATLDLISHILRTRRDHPREAVRYLADAVVAVAGPVLPDDATLLILDWHGGHQNPRDSHAGADIHAPSLDLS